MAGEELVLVSELAFLSRLLNPCQVSLTGALLPRVRSPPSRQHLPAEQQRAEELAIELHRASTLASQLREFAAVPDCSGLPQLGSQRVPPLSLSGLPRQHALLELYRSSLYEAIHLHLMVDEINKSHQTCGNQTLRLVDQMFMLSASLQNIMCVITETLPEQLLEPVVAEVADVTLRRYHICSRRLMRNCLVLESTSRMLAVALEYVHEAELSENGFLPLRVARSI
ncbi:uncharacterized protein LOC122380258 [Amphibalanus amphitrite]|nr:uncharacterized protein LOC122380258 [Amphibalanus amphitrite]